MNFIVVFLSLCLVGFVFAKPPNVVVILTDDQGWGDLSLHGNKNLSTPHIDSLARDGASFERFYVCPVCSPTRAEFLTGRYHVRGGVYSTSAGGERLDLDEKTIADTFKAAANSGLLSSERAEIPAALGASHVRPPPVLGRDVKMCPSVGALDILRLASSTTLSMMVVTPSPSEVTSPE